jgi:hypothetical protein
VTADGEALRDAALALLAERRASLVRAGQRALLGALLERGEATADDVRALVPLPAGIRPCLYGAVPLPLADLGLIRAAGYRRTERPQGHARPVAVWQLADRAGAVTWLRDHPELEAGELTQRDLWD